MNVRVQTTGVDASVAFMDALETLYKMSEIVDDSFRDAVARHPSHAETRAPHR